MIKKVPKNLYFSLLKNYRTTIPKYLIRFCSNIKTPQPIIEEDTADLQTIFDKEREKNENIKKMLDIEDVVNLDIDGKQSQFHGSLIIIPTPVGNMRDMSQRIYEALHEVDIIACEDTRFAGKLFTQMKEKNFKTLYSDQYWQDKQNAEILDEFEEESKEIYDIIAHDKKVWEQLREEHPNFYDLRRDKAKLKEYYQRDNIVEMIKKGDNILDDIDTQNFLKKEHDKEYGSFKREGGVLYDTKSYRRKNKANYGIDDDFISFMKDKIYKTKLNKGRGVFISCHKFNEAEKTDQLIRCMQNGMKIGLICDAGTPTLSDPGNILVAASIKQGIIVESQPGPSAITVALSSSGFPSDCYIFVGYLSKTLSDKKKKLEELKEQKQTFQLFENKNRILKTLLTIEKVFGKQHLVCVGIELTKMHERNLRGTIEEVYDRINTTPDYTMPSLKGEITIVVAPYTEKYNVGLVVENEELSMEKSKRTFYFDRTLEVNEMLENNHNVMAEELVNSQKDTLDISHRDLCELTSVILKIPFNRASEIVRWINAKTGKSMNQHLDITMKGLMDEIK